MPSTLPSRSTGRAASSAIRLARPPERSTGIWLSPSISERVSGLTKYSFLARKYTGRRVTIGMTSESTTDRWLLARITGPVDGTISSPETFGRQSARSIGATVTLPNEYSADTASGYVSRQILDTRTGYDPMPLT
jgi:hypothetical protein